MSEQENDLEGSKLESRLHTRAGLNEQHVEDAVTERMCQKRTPKVIGLEIQISVHDTGNKSGEQQRKVFEGSPPGPPFRPSGS